MQRMSLVKLRMQPRARRTSLSSSTTSTPASISRGPASKDHGSNFVCSQCRIQKSVDEMCHKNTQVWCMGCNRSYCNFLTRCKTQPKLKPWWSSMESSQTVDWFRKGGKLSTSQKANSFSFILKGVHAMEIIEDEIDKWITYDKWLEGKGHLGLTEAQLEARWKQEVESCQSECLFVRGRWLLPRFEGVERRTRTRFSQEVEIFRQIDIRNANEMHALWQQHTSAIGQWSKEIQPVRTVAPLHNDPHVAVQPQDMPHRLTPSNLMLDTIGRDVNQVARTAAMQRSLEAAEAVEAAQNVGDEDATDQEAEGEEKKAKRARVPFGVERTATENSVKLQQKKIEEMRKSMEEDSDKLFEDLKKLYAGEDGQLEGGALQQWNELKEAKDQAQKAFETFLSQEFPGFIRRVEAATCPSDLKHVSSNMKERLSTFKKSEHVRTCRELLTKTKRSSTLEAKKQLKASSAKGVSEGAGVTEGVRRPAFSSIIDALMLKHVGGYNITSSLYETKVGIRASRVVAETDKKGCSYVDEIRKNQYLKTLAKGLTQGLQDEGKTHMTTVLRGQPKRKKLEGLITKAFTRNMTSKLMLPDESWAHRIYQPELYGCTAVHSSIFPTNNGCCEARLFLSGSQTVCGLPLETIPGITLSEKRLAVANMTIDELSNFMTEKKGWCLHMGSVDDVVYFVPSGHLLLISSQDCIYLRWGVSADDQDTARVKCVCTSIAESFTEFRNASNPLGSFLAWLSEQDE